MAKQKEREMVNTPNTWVRRPFLPLYRDNDDDTTSLALLIEGQGLVVFRANLLDAYVSLNEWGNRKSSKGFKKWLASLASYKYASFDDLWADGWRVD